MNNIIYKKIIKVLVDQMIPASNTYKMPRASNTINIDLFYNQIRNNPNLEKKVGMSCGKKDNNGDFHNTSRWPAECPICARRQTVRELKVEEALDNANVVCEDENCDFKLDWQLLVP